MGTSLSSCPAGCHSADHPHAYGDKCTDEYTIADYMGSSPRVWGQDGLMKPYEIPAVDHPHAYGDKFAFCVVNFNTPGSSPRVWGQGLLMCRCLPPGRIIPTRMGTSTKSDSLSKLPWDHPHAYGDKPCSKSRFCRI